MTDKFVEYELVALNEDFICLPKESAKIHR